MSLHFSVLDHCTNYLLNFFRNIISNKSYKIKGMTRRVENLAILNFEGVGIKWILSVTKSEADDGSITNTANGAASNDDNTYGHQCKE